jgi:Glyoxalase-like domain
MGRKIQVTIDCADPGRLTRFWSTALGYEIQPPPNGFPTWNAYWRSIGVPEDELDDANDASDSVVDPDGVGPRIWFQQVPEGKVVKNRLHLDLDVGGGRGVPLEVRRQRVTAEAERLAAEGATRLRVQQTEGMDHFGIVMQDPEGNEFCLF